MRGTFLVMGLAACADDAGDRTIHSEDDTYTPCSTYPEDRDTVLLYADPRDSSREFYYRDPIAVRFNRPPVGPVTMALRDEEGALVEATVELVGEWATLTPTRPLSPQTTYRLAVEWGCDGSEVTSFATSATGVPVSPELFDERVFALDLGASEPSGGGRFFLAVGGSAVQLLSVEDLGAQGTWAATPSWGTLQDGCVPTEAWTGVAQDNPWFEVTGRVPVPVELGLVFSARVSGAVDPDGAALGGVRLDGTLDVRGATPRLLADLGLDPSKGDVCEVAAAWGSGVGCVSCADGVLSCWPVSFAGVPAGWAEHLDGLDLRAAEDIAADAACRPR
jgi:hypothetical protein